jgi:hypothetical protein
VEVDTILQRQIAAVRAAGISQQRTIMLHLDVVWYVQLKFGNNYVLA